MLTNGRGVPVLKTLGPKFSWDGNCLDKKNCFSPALASGPSDPSPVQLAICVGERGEIMSTINRFIPARRVSFRRPQTFLIETGGALYSVITKDTDARCPRLLGNIVIHISTKLTVTMQSGVQCGTWDKAQWVDEILPACRVQYLRHVYLPTDC